MTEPQHYQKETPKDNSTIKCVLGILGATVALFSTRVAAPLIVSSGVDPIMATVVLRSVLACSSSFWAGAAGCASTRRPFGARGSTRGS